MVDIPLRCWCGTLAGVARDVSPDEGFRFVCYCTDCQAFARFLERPELLDDAGGTDIVQLPAGRVRFTQGLDVLGCVRFSEKVFRWYATCCRTPVANTAPRFPVIALLRPVMGPVTRDAALGPPRCRIYEASASGPLPASAPPPATARLIARRGYKLVQWRLRGLHRPNPFFDARTGRPRAEPTLRDPL
ncbi:MAG TPA: DUF6151 family protein [Kofleriaceae bacterium]|jgi:hypothetical protein